MQIYRIYLSIYTFTLICIKQLQKTSDEDEKLRERRERNRNAAARCRLRRLMTIKTLQYQADMAERKKSELLRQIKDLHEQKRLAEFTYTQLTGQQWQSTVIPLEICDDCNTPAYAFPPESYSPFNPGSQGAPNIDGIPAHLSRMAIDGK